MKLPAFLYGRLGEVKKNGKRMVTQLRRGVPWAELADEMIDTRDMPGLIMVDNLSRSLHGEHFLTFVPAWAVRDAVLDGRLPREGYEALFESALSTLWGFMAMLSRQAGGFWPPWQQQRFLQATVHYWDELDAEGERYSVGGDMAERLWALPTMIHYCLANQGLPEARFHEPIPPGGMRALVNQTAARLD